MSKLIVPITAEPITANPREAEMYQMVFTREWEIELTMDLYEKNAEGDRLFDLASTKEGLTQKQREIAREKYFPKRPTAYTTKDSFVNELGQIDPNGETREIDFLFSLTFSQLKGIMGKTDDDSVLQTIKEFVGQKMQDISNRGQN